MLKPPGNQSRAFRILFLRSKWVFSIPGGKIILSMLVTLPKRMSSFVFYLLPFVFSTAAAQTGSSERAASIIFDSDIGPDYDDVGAMAVMHALADSGEARILATIASNQSRYIAGVMSVINTYFHRPEIPVGVTRNPRSVNMTASQKWDSILVARFPAKIKTNSQAEDALQLYRKILSSQPDKSVTIITVGFLSNLNDLLKSGADRYSPLNGRDLVKKKVRRLVSMAGRFPKGAEYNVQCDPISAKYVAENWPSEIIFSGWEIGNAVHTGLPLIKREDITGSPIKTAFEISIPLAPMDSLGRMSWDETAVLVAIKGYAPYYRVTEGRMICHEWGSNEWDDKGNGHFYLTEEMPPSDVESILNTLMMHQPSGGVNKKTLISK